MQTIFYADPSHHVCAECCNNKESKAVTSNFDYRTVVMMRVCICGIYFPFHYVAVQEEQQKTLGMDSKHLTIKLKWNNIFATRVTA